MNEVCEIAIECYIKKLESDNEKLRDFANKVRSITFDFDGSNPDKSDGERAEEVRTLVRMYEPDFKED